MQATFNQVSHCCNRPIITGCKYDPSPLGRNEYNGSGLIHADEICESCGKDCSPVDQCEKCGVVGCIGNCGIIEQELEQMRMLGIVDISEGEKDERN
jgi:hypothetical protein